MGIQVQTLTAVVHTSPNEDSKIIDAFEKNQKEMLCTTHSLHFTTLSIGFLLIIVAWGSNVAIIISLALQLYGSEEGNTWETVPF